MKNQLLKDIVITVWDSLLAHKLRSALTLLGIIIGVTVVVLVGSILASLSAALTANVQSFSPNVIYFTKEEKIGPQFGTPSAEERARKEISYECVKAVAELDSPLAVSPQKVRGSYGPSADQPKMSARGREAITPLILGVWDNYPEVVNIDLAEGRFFTEIESRSRSKVLVLGYSVAAQLFQTNSPVGEEIRLDGDLYRVVGLLKDDGDEFAGKICYAPYETIASEYPENEANIIVVRAPPGREDEVITQVTYTLRRLRNVPVEAPNNFGVNRAEQVFEAIQNILAGITVIIAPVALAGLAVGGVGVMNIMIVAVTERSAEIGVRRAIGARRRDVLVQFLIEAIILTSLGGMLGILLGLLLAFLVSLIMGFPFSVPMWAVVTGLLTSASVGLFAGIYPAARAARLDPVVAIRGN
ncbi:MAG: ABC transporter permease [Acidobacteria bacterium]|nr:ABC transporter permease [Acidobacteriota bacterium]